MIITRNALLILLGLSSASAFTTTPTTNRAFTVTKSASTRFIPTSLFAEESTNGETATPPDDATAAVVAAAAATIEVVTETLPPNTTETVIHPPNAIDHDPSPEPPTPIEPPPPAGYEISSSGTVHTLTINLGIPNHPPLILQTGKIGRQAAGAVTITRGNTVLYSTAAYDASPRDVDFLPLSVDYQERFSSAGLTSGSYNKRDGRPAEHEILVCRLIDRPLRPLVADGWRHDTQLLSWVLSYDGVRSCDALAIVASAASLWVSDVPLAKPVAAVIVGRIGDEFVLNPTNEEMERSSLNLVLAGTKDAVLMIEGAAEFLPEEVMMEAVTFGHEKGIKIICEALEEFGKVVGVEKKTDTLVHKPSGLQERVNELMSTKVDELFEIYDKKEHSTTTSQLSAEIVSVLEPEYPDTNPDLIRSAFKTLLQRKMYTKAKTTNTRVDGRKLDVVRPITIEPSLLPSVHGSSLFTRGETQAIATATLGDAGMRQKIDKIDGLFQKRFYLQYTFPPSCVGETGRVGAPGRREVGHGNLAERALIPAIPSEEEFPYTIRVESLITESHGSSSMASVCGGTLALMDAGVPIKRPVAGIAMGMLLDVDESDNQDDEPVILSDILGTEDALGMMDFKVAGDREGITTFQLDIKCEGLTLNTMAKALEQARVGRLHILDKMAEVLPEPQSELPPTVPRLKSFSIDENSIGKVIGPGGKQIRAIIEDFGLTNMDVGEDGTIQISSMNTTVLDEAIAFVQNLVTASPRRGGPGGGGGGRGPRVEYSGPPPEVGKTYTGKITGIHQFGVFVEILPGTEEGMPGLEGLCHVSELHVERVRNCEAFMNSLNLETMEVKLLGKNDRGKWQLSRKAVLEDKLGRGPGSKKSVNGAGKKKPQSEKKPVRQEMDQGEIDAITEAIESVFDE